MQNFFKNNVWRTLLITLVFFSVACNPDDPTPVAPAVTLKDFDHTSISRWNHVFLEIERFAAGYRPGPAPRALGLIGMANYEACLTGMPDFKSVAILYPGLSIPQADPRQEYHYPTVINASTAFLMKRFFANMAADQQAKITALENSLDADGKNQADPAVYAKSVEYGKAVASAVWEWSKTDTYGHDQYLDPFGTYKWQDHFDGDGDFVPLNPGPPQPMFPYWGKARTFAISEADKLCVAPIPYSNEKSSQFYAQANEVYARTKNATYEDIWIGEFWSDDLLNLTFSPGPRWIAIANQVYEAEKSNLETAVWANVKVGMAMNDAAVACWHSKYFYNVERPESYIKREIEADWEPLLLNPANGVLVTPQFPAYPSGHSTMGGAAAEVLTDIFGISYAMTDRCHENRTEFEGKPRSFQSFYDMADENAISRVPLGVHYPMDCTVGVDLGEACGRKVNRLPWKK
jgi:membrane-associated phospholipid phosphatase